MWEFSCIIDGKDLFCIGQWLSLLGIGRIFMITSCNKHDSQRGADGKCGKRKSILHDGLVWFEMTESGYAKALSWGDVSKFMVSRMKLQAKSLLFVQHMTHFVMIKCRDVILSHSQRVSRVKQRSAVVRRSTLGTSD